MRWLERLPSEVLLTHILAYLPLHSLWNFSSCSRFTHSLILQEQLWKLMIIHHFNAKPAGLPSGYSSFRSLYIAMRGGAINVVRGKNVAVNEHGSIVRGSDGQAYTKTLTPRHNHQFLLRFRSLASPATTSSSSSPLSLARPSRRASTVIVGVGPSLSRTGANRDDDHDGDDDDGCFCLTDCRRAHRHLFEYVDIPDCDMSDAVTITITSIKLLPVNPSLHSSPPPLKRRKRQHSYNLHGINDSYIIEEYHVPKTLTATICVERDGEVVGQVGMTFPTQDYGGYNIKGLRLAIGLRPNNNSEVFLSYLPLA